MTDEKQTLEDFAVSLIGDLEDLRANRITVKEAKARAELGREVLRAFHLHLQGLRFITSEAKAIEPPTNGDRKD